MSRALVVAYLLYFGVARSAIPLYSFGDLLPLPVSFRFFGFFLRDLGALPGFEPAYPLTQCSFLGRPNHSTKASGGLSYLHFINFGYIYSTPSFCFFSTGHVVPLGRLAAEGLPFGVWRQGLCRCVSVTCRP